MAPVASQLIEEVTEHAHSDSLEDAREIGTDGTYFPNNLRISTHKYNVWAEFQVSSKLLTLQRWWVLKSNYCYARGAF